MIAVDNDGNFWHIIAGAVIGAVIGGGVEAARQYIATGKVEDWGRVGAAAAGGAVSGAIQAALPGVGTVAVMGYGAVAGAAGGMTERLVATGGKSAGSVSQVLVDAGVGALTAGVIKGGSSVFRSVAKAARPATVEIAESAARRARPLVIGENMSDRVKPFAAKIGADIYDGLPGFKPGMEDEGLAHNRAIIEQAKSEGRTIIDIGPDFAKRAREGRASPNYEMERTNTKNYPGYEKAFARSGDTTTIVEPSHD